MGPQCQSCEKPATCFGAYEGNKPETFACSDCCAHGNEDGACYPIADHPNNPENNDYAASKDDF